MFELAGRPRIPSSAPGVKPVTASDALFAYPEGRPSCTPFMLWRAAVGACRVVKPVRLLVTLSLVRLL